MGIPRGDGPDLIINRMKDSVAVSWKLVFTVIIVMAWGLFVIAPYFLAENPSQGRESRWTIVALVAIVVTYGLPSVVASERRGAAFGMVVAAALVIVLAWVLTA